MQPTLIKLSLILPTPRPWSGVGGESAHNTDQLCAINIPLTRFVTPCPTEVAS